MTDQLPNNNQTPPAAPVNPLMQGPPPSTATVLPDAPPPQDIAVDPIPLPSSSPSNMVNPSMESATSSDINIETVIESESVKMQEVVIDPVPEIIAELGSNRRRTAWNQAVRFRKKILQLSAHPNHLRTNRFLLLANILRFLKSYSRDCRFSIFNQRFVSRYLFQFPEFWCL